MGFLLLIVTTTLTVIAVAVALVAWFTSRSAIARAEQIASESARRSDQGSAAA